MVRKMIFRISELHVQMQFKKKKGVVLPFLKLRWKCHVMWYVMSSSSGKRHFCLFTTTLDIWGKHLWKPTQNVSRWESSYSFAYCLVFKVLPLLTYMIHVINSTTGSKVWLGRIRGHSGRYKLHSPRTLKQTSKYLLWNRFFFLSKNLL